uniref:dTDP-4-dehydrorhamnose 3,5-epimerase n=1 Tax=Arcella intermedia TaxID=1963864 RepID=A0A6B2LLZ8_9EUKA
MERHFDERGFFQEHYHSMKYPWVGGVAQTSYSHSRRDVLRGLHRSQYGKLVQCVSGRLFDVMVDLRKDSPTYLNWFGIWLSGDELKQVFIPAGCAHGFYAAENNTVLLYTQEGNFDPQKDKNINYADPAININWPPPQGPHYIMSPKDLQAPMVQDTL